MNALSPPTRGFFSPESLDLKDRQILEVVCKYGRVGQSFNKLVEEVKPFISRSTFAVRLERLQRLNYIEKLPDEKMKQVKRIRGNLQARMLMWNIARAKEGVATIVKLISEKEEELSKAPISERLSAEQVEGFRAFLRQILLERTTNIFSSVATIAVTYGEAAAGDIFLPSITEDFRDIVRRLSSLVRKNPDLAKATLEIREKPSDESLREVRMFFEEFGEEILEKIPKSLEARKAIISEVIKDPEKLSLLISTLWSRM